MSDMDTEVLAKLSKDLKQCVSTMTANEARFLVDSYYQMQQNRTRADNQVRSAEGEPNRVLGWLSGNASALEQQIKSALGAYAESQHMGRWAMSVVGCGPITAAALLAYIDISQCPTVGHIWRFAGLDPSVRWPSTDQAKAWVKEQGGVSDELIAKAALHWGRNEATLRRYATTNADGEPVKLTADTLAKAISRRPFNLRLKTVLYNLGECFIKSKSREGCVYGKLYETRKAYEQQQNESGVYAEQAKGVVEKRPTHAQRKVYAGGKLPPGHIHSRARRYVIKQFLSDWHAEAYRDHFKQEPPKPYPIAILGHAHMRKAA